MKSHQVFVMIRIVVMVVGLVALSPFSSATDNGGTYGWRAQSSSHVDLQVAQFRPMGMLINADVRAQQFALTHAASTAITYRSDELAGRPFETPQGPGALTAGLATLALMLYCFFRRIG